MWTVIDTPIGPLRLVEQRGLLTSIEFSPFSGTGRPRGDRGDREPVLARTRAQLAAYFAGEVVAFELPLDPQGTEFQLRVWEELRKVPYGETITYGDLAARIGRTSASARAVGHANGQNPIPIIQPCHRVIGSDGSLTGFAGGLERKRFLLELERPALF